MMSSVLPFAPPPDPPPGVVGLPEGTDAENTEAFVAALAAAMGLVPVGRAAAVPLGQFGFTANGDALSGANAEAAADEPDLAIPLPAAAVPQAGDAAADTPQKPVPRTTSREPVPVPTLGPEIADDALTGAASPPETEGPQTSVTPVPLREQQGRFTLPRDVVTQSTEAVVEGDTPQKVPQAAQAATTEQKPREQASSDGAPPRADAAQAPPVGAPRGTADPAPAAGRHAVNLTASVGGTEEVTEPAPTPQHHARVEVVDANGDRATIRVALRGDAVKTTIVHPDGHVVEDLRANTAELRRALQDQGLTSARVRVHAVGGNAAAGPGDAPSTSSDQPFEQREHGRQRQPDADREWATGRDGRRDRDNQSGAGRERER